jgi:hypothetical protein
MLGAGALLLAPALGLGGRQGTEDWENEAIAYRSSKPDDPITHLQSALDSGKLTLAFDPRRGYLPAVLTALHIPIASQTLVFSKTSFQHELISPDAPRALYFNDETYIGWVQQGPVLEVATVDPSLGAVFYLLPQTKTARPRFVRTNDECLECHGASMTNQVPGLVMRSVYAGPDGQPDFSQGSYLTTDESPIKERWGGWYVTGTHGRQRHMGNAFARRRGDQVDLDTDSGANVTSLANRLDTAPYLAATSDLVALMVMEHQTHLQNLIVKASYQTRIALRYEQALNKELGRPADYRSDSTVSRIASVCDPLVKAMLFCGETRLTDPITGTSGFAQRFSAEGPRDPQGRSLKQLDLKTRLLQYPCSWMIYSPLFDAMPQAARDYVYQRLSNILTGKDGGKDFAQFSDADRKAVLEILTATKPSFAGWRTAHA